MERYLKLFCAYIKSINYSPRTIEGYERHIKKFFQYLKSELNITDIKKVNREIILGYQQHLFTSKSCYDEFLAVGSQSAYLGSIKTFFRFMVLHDYILFDPTTLLELPRREKYLPRVILSRKEINILLKQPDIATIQGYRDRTILEIFYATGIRSGELINLNIFDPDIQKGTLMIRLGKGAKDRVVPLTDTAAEFTEGYILNIRKKLLRANKTDALILNNYGKRIDEAKLLRIIRSYAQKAKLRKADEIGCHTLRHTCASHLLESGANIRYIQELLGHESLETTQIYTKVQITDLKKIHTKYHPREKF